MLLFVSLVLMIQFMPMFVTRKKIPMGTSPSGEDVSLDSLRNKSKLFVSDVLRFVWVNPGEDVSFLSRHVPNKQTQALSTWTRQNS